MYQVVVLLARRDEKGQRRCCGVASTRAGKARLVRHAHLPDRVICIASTTPQYCNFARTLHMFTRLFSSDGILGSQPFVDLCTLFHF
jgi:hypothetical protein